MITGRELKAGLRSPVVNRGVDIRILGPLRISRDGVELDPGPPRQRLLFAHLLARAGQPVSTAELIDLLWGDDVPASALNVVQKYVGALRRLLEPDLPPRASGSHLHRRGNGYLFPGDPRTLDLLRFRELARAAVSLDDHAGALALWRGPSPFAALHDELFTACVAAAPLAVCPAQAERILPALRLAASLAPLHEPVQAALVAVLTVAGHRAEARSAYRQVHTRLTEELGIDPGAALLAAGRRALDPVAPTSGDTLVGRAGELAVLSRAVESARSGGTGLVLLEGEPGAGKTRLVEEATTRAGRAGVQVVWGRCLEDGGAPAMWPWMRVVASIVDTLPAADRGRWLATELGHLVESGDPAHAAPVAPDAGSRFRLFERVVALLGHVAADRPMMLVVDDLQWADLASLDLFGHLAARLPNGVAAVGVLRDRAPAPGPELSRLLAATSRLAGHRRIRLGPLGPAEVAELVRREIGAGLAAGVADVIHARTAGNPFFVQELSRLIALDDRDGAATVDAVSRAAVPSTVRDVVGEWVSRLGTDAGDLLRAAALIGREVDLRLLARVAGLGPQTCLDRIEAAEHLGLLLPSPGDPFVFRFAHDLVRETVAATTSPHREARLHLRVADVLEAGDTKVASVAERAAHHLWAAGPLADPARTADAMICAGRRAAAKSALEAAERHLRSAVRMARTAGSAERELTALSELTVVIGMGPGYAGSTIDLLERAEHLARQLGREQEAVNFLLSRQAAYCQRLHLDAAARLAREFLDRTASSADPVLRAYGLHTWAIHRWAAGDIAGAFDYQSRSDRTLLEDIDGYREFSLRRDLHLIAAGMHAEISALHGDAAAARSVLDTLEAAGDDPYAITLWAAFASTVAVLSGDADRARHTAARGIAEDPGFSFAFFGAHVRMNHCWARAVTGDDPAGAAAEAEAVLTAKLLDPPLTGLANWYALIAEMWLAAGRPDAAATALDRACHAMRAHGERYAEGLLLLLRARLARALGEPAAVVRAAAVRAREVSTARGAHLFARRATGLLGELGA